MITSFSGKFEFLSNFHPAEVRYEGITYRTVEHAYQASKTLDLGDRQRIAELTTPGQAKRAGRDLMLRPDWHQIREFVMLGLLRQKFAAGTELAVKLTLTGTEYLIEGNNWGDRFWGCERVGARWVGQNNLGKLLMLVRKELEKGTTNV